MNKKSKIVIPPMTGAVLYKTYKNGTFKDLKDMIFGHTEKNDSPADGPNEITTAETLHGLAAQNIEFDPSVYQYYPDTCAIRSQQLVLQQFGIETTQEELIEVAKENGWYVEGHGTPMNMVGKLLEYHGVHAHGSEGNNIFNLSNELAQGHQVIAAVDENELLFPEGADIYDEMQGEDANHALVVVGLDTSDTNNIQVIVTDPVNGNREMAYPVEQFLNAWKDSDCFMVTTEEVPTAPLYPCTPIDSLAGIPKDYLGRLADMDIDTSQDEMYSDFLNDFFNNPEQLDELLVQYDDLFDFDDLEEETSC